MHPERSDAWAGAAALAVIGDAASEPTLVRYCANIPRRPRPERGTFVPTTRFRLA